MRKLHPGAKRDLPEVRYLRQHERVFVKVGITEQAPEGACFVALDQFDFFRRGIWQWGFLTF